MSTNKGGASNGQSPGETGESSRSNSQDNASEDKQSNRQPEHRLSNTDEPVSALARSDNAILLRNAVLNTSLDTPLRIPEPLKAKGDPGAYIVQSDGPIDQEFRASIQAAGGEIVSYIPNNALLVSIDEQAARQLNNAGTRAVVPYEPYFKLDDGLLDAVMADKGLPEEAMFEVVLFRSKAAAAQEEIVSEGNRIVSRSETPFGPAVVVEPKNRGQNHDLVALAQMTGVQGIERWRQRALLNDLSRVRVGISSNPTNATSSNHLSLSGKGIPININDTGVDASHPDLAGRVTALDSTYLSDSDGHGTHVAGTLASSGENSPSGDDVPGSVSGADFRGMAPESELFVLPIDLTTGPLKSDAYLQQAAATNNFIDRGRTNALISNNSWGYIQEFSYDSSAASYDAAVRDALPERPGDQPIMYVFGAGNDGFANDNGLGGEPGSIISPATAKNVISVGALEQFRNITNQVVVTNETGTVSTNQPFATETDSRNQVADLSSRGNVGLGVEGEFGRFKPDVVAPGSFVVSTRSEGWEHPTSFEQPTVNNIEDQTVAPGERLRHQIFVPSGASELTIELRANEASPDPLPGLPTFMKRGGVPGLQDLVNTNNEVTLPEDLPLSSGQWFYSIGNFGDEPVSFDIRTILIQTNSAAGRFEALKELNEDLGEQYRYETGTSMAAPVISGTLALMEEYLQEEGYSYSPALLKALLINGARSANRIYGFDVRSQITHQGWGLPRLDNSLPARPFGNQSAAVQFVDQSPENAVATGQKRTWNLDLSEEARQEELRVTLTWTDPPGNPNAGIKLVNNLDLVITNRNTGEVFRGNHFSANSDFTLPSNPDGGSITNDVVNNVENVFLSEPLGTNYSVTVVGERVNVNAVANHPEGVVQDFALAVSTSNASLTNAVTMSAEPEESDFDPGLTVVRNGVPLLEQRVGASSPLQGGDSGLKEQWRFYVFTNSTVQTGDELSITNGTNVAFSTFIPPNLSEPARNVDADIDLYVSRNNPALTNLNPTAIQDAFKSQNEGGTEVVTFTNAEIGEVFYVGVKSEDHRGAEFGFVALSTDQPFAEEDENGNRVLNGQPSTVTIPDGSPDDPQSGYVFAISPQPGTVRNVRASVTITHESIGDLSGNLSHNGQFVVLNNHTVNRDFPSGTQTLIYDDSNGGTTANRNVRTSDGPGSLNNFIGGPASGLWLFTVVDNALNEGGSVDDFTVTIERVPEDQTDIRGTVQANRFSYYSIDVPQNATNLTATLSSIDPSAPLDLFVRREQLPTTSQFDKLARIEPPGGSLVLTPRDVPPLNAGQYFIGVFNPNSFAVDFRLMMDVGIDTEAEGFDRFTSGSLKLKDNAITRSRIQVPEDLRVAALRPGIRIDHPRASDLAVRLESPQGTSVLLTENRGGTEAAGYGIGTTNISFATFTDDTNVTTTPIKFAEPPFHVDESALEVTNRLLVSNGFEGASEGVVTNGGTVAGWTVTQGNITLETSEGGAHTGTNYVRLSSPDSTGGVLTNVNTVIGSEYLLSFAYRRSGSRSSTAIYTNNVLAKFIPPSSGGWQTTQLVFRARSPETSFELRSVSSEGPLIDSVEIWEVPELPDAHYLPEESLEPIVGERALGEWELEIWDTRAGPEGESGTLLDWKLQLDFARPTIQAARLTNGVPLRGTVTGNETEFFVVDVPRSATAATNILAGTGDLMLIGDRNGLPVGDPDQDDYFVDRLGVDQGEFMLLTTNRPTAAPLRPGRRYFLGVKNFDPTETNSFTLQVNFDRVDQFDDSDIPELEEGVARTDTIPAGPGLQYYRFTVSTNAVEALFELLPQNGNVDLFVRKKRPVIDPLPTRDVYDYRSIRPGTEVDPVAVALESRPVGLTPGTWYLGVQNVDDSPVDYEIRATETTVNVQSVPFDTPVTQTNEEPQSFDYFAFDVPGGGVKATFESLNADGNVDLILKRGLPLPSVNQFDYVSDNPGTEDEAIVVTNTSQPVPLEPGLWHLGAYNNSDGPVSYTIRGTVEIPQILTLTNGVARANRVSDTNLVDYYEFEVSPAAERAVFETFNADGDVNLLLRRGFPLPSELNFHFASTNGMTNDERIIVRTNSLPVSLRPGDWFVSVINQETNPVNYSIRAEELAPTIHTLTNQVPFTNQISGDELFDFYRFTVSTNAVEATFETLETDGDVDLFLKKGLPLATSKNFDYASTNVTQTNEMIVVSTNSTPVPLEPGDWFLSVLNREETNVSYTVQASERFTGPSGTNFINPRITVTTNEVCLDWDSSPDNRYVVQGKKSVAAQGWTDISSEIVATNDVTRFCVDQPTEFQFFQIAEKGGEPPPQEPEEFVDAKISLTSTNICVQWESKVGTNYVVQAKADVAQAEWEPVSSTITATETTSEFCVELPTDYRFFRVAVLGATEPPPPSEPVDFIDPTIGLSSTNLCLQWTSQVGTNYVVQARESIDQGSASWETISPTISASETTSEFCVELPSEYRFFRIGVLAGGATPSEPEFVKPTVAVTQTDICLTWMSEVGATYRVEAKTNITQAAWEAVSSDINATETSTEFCVELPTEYRFFRVAVVDGNDGSGNGMSAGEVRDQTEFTQSLLTANGFELSWQAPPNQTFQVQYTTSFPATWQDVGSPVTSTDESYSFIDEDATVTESRRYYRLIINP